MGLLRREDGDPVMLEPGNNGVRDRIDLYYANTNPSRLKTIKKVAKIGIKGIHALFGATVVPDLSLAFYKATIAATIE